MPADSVGSLPRTLPGRVDIATRILAAVDDPDTNVVRLAAAVVGDPSVTARVIALANSAYYGLSRRVSTIEYSISVVGFEAVRAIALRVCLGLDGTRPVPDGFWNQASLSAVAAGLVAPRLGAEPAEAFCAGLLLTIGSATLHQQSDLPALCLPTPDDSEAFLQRESDLYGIDHAAAGADLLALWNFPASICAAVAQHHEEAQPDDPPLKRVICAARLLAASQLGPDNAITQDELSAVTFGQLAGADVEELTRDIAARAEALLLAMS